MKKIYFGLICFMLFLCSGLSVNAQDQLYLVGNWTQNAWNPWASTNPVLKKSSWNDKVYIGYIPAEDSGKAFKIYPNQSWDGGFGVGNGEAKAFINGMTVDFAVGGADFQFKDVPANQDLILVADLSATPYKLTAYAHIYLLGGSKNPTWTVGNAPELKRVSAGVYSLTGTADYFTANGDDGYRLYLSNDLTIGASATDENVVRTLSNNVVDVVPAQWTNGNASGKFTYKTFPEGNPEVELTLNLNKGTLTTLVLPVDRLYIAGGAHGWGMSDDHSLAKTENYGIYSGTFNINDLFGENGGDLNGFRFYIGQNKWSAVICPDQPDQNDKLTFNLNYNPTRVAGKIGMNSSTPTFYIDPSMDTSGIKDEKVTVTVDIYNGTVDFKYDRKLYTPKKLYAVGTINGNNWQDKSAVEFTKTTEGVFTLENATFASDDYNGFQLLTGQDWTSDRFLNSGDGGNMTPSSNERGMYYFKNGDQGEQNFSIQKGMYNITVDFNNGKVSVVPVDGIRANVAFNLSFWEGPINETLKPSNANADNIPFKFVRVNDSGSYVYKIDVAKDGVYNDKVIEYVSQGYFGGRAALIDWKWNDDKTACVNTIIHSTNLENNLDAWDTFYFDAHEINALVPLKREFWCGNSRMEVGMLVKSIYLAYNPDLYGDHGLRILFSDKEDTYIIGAREQKPLNGDKYTLELADGDLYKKLKGTRNGAIKISFSRHALAHEGYAINLGKSITLSKDERFILHVDPSRKGNDGKVIAPYTVKFADIDQSNTYYAGTNNGGVSLLREGMKFNQIILFANGDNYDSYQIWFRNSEAENNAPNDPKKGIYNEYLFNRTQEGKPLLKVWKGNPAAWLSMYEVKNLKPFMEDGDVKYFAFQPIETNNNLIDKHSSSRTNLYFLDLSNEDVKIHRGGYAKTHFEADNNDYPMYDQFNIMDQDGYDVSNPFSGSQFIYPEAWWCANPHMAVDDDYQGDTQLFENGTKFRKPRQDMFSNVDLSWDLNGGLDEQRIYGITLFKVMGNVYDIYTEGETETNLYYIYAHTSPEEAAALSSMLKANGGVKDEALLKKCYKYAPILLSVKDGVQIDTFDGGELKPFEAKTSDNEEYKKYNTPTFPAGTKQYMLHLSDKRYNNNSDLNWTIDNVNFKANGIADAFEFIDVNGSQRWSADEGDKLQPNIWSNYYAGDFDTKNPLEINDPAQTYYKVVLATNPDQVRYQLMADAVSIQNHNSFDYNPDGDLIYPKTEVKTTLVTHPGETLTVKLTDKDGKDLGVVITVTCDDKGNVVAKMVDKEGDKEIVVTKAQDDDESFFEDGESLIELPLGEFFVGGNVEFGVTVESSKEGKAPLKSPTVSTGDLPKPGLDNLTATPKDMTDEDNGKYTSDLSWDVTDPYDFPHHYYFTASDSNKNDATSDHTGKNGTSKNDVDIENATKFADVKEQDADGNKTVTIGYKGHSEFHFAVPEKGFIPYKDHEGDWYTNLPEGFKPETTSSEEDSTTAEFKKNVASGVDAVEVENVPVEYYNLQGVKVAEPVHGLYIRVQGKKSEKVMFK